MDETYRTGSQAYRSGRDVGRALSTAVALAETGIGITGLLGGAVITGSGAAAALVSCPLVATVIGTVVGAIGCVVSGGGVMAGVTVMAGSAVLALHGGAVLAYIRDNSPGGKGGGPTRQPYQLGPNDLDWRGRYSDRYQAVNDALDEAFKKTGVSRDEFKATQWARGEDGIERSVEWQGPRGAEVSMDNPHSLDGPDIPHIGWKGPRKGGLDGDTMRGHILLDWVPASRP